MVENIRLAFSALLANKMRALLTMLGIIIGISSVIMIFTVGHALTAMVGATLEGIGGNRITLEERRLEDSDNYTYQDQLNDKSITDELLQDMKVYFSEEVIDYSITLNHYNLNVEYEGEIIPVNIVGINTGYILDQQLSSAYGKLFDEKDIINESNFVLISEKLSEDYFPGEDPVGKKLVVSNNEGTTSETFHITGVYTQEENLLFSSGYASAYVPISTAESIGDNNFSFYNNATLIVDDSINVDEFINKANIYLANYTEGNIVKELVVTSYGDIMQEFNTMMLTLQLAISAVAGISLLVGGIGVMNIMLVSISERTKEIGTRKALGAQRKDILTQFIIESIIICLMGGIIGILLGVGGGMAISVALGFPAVADINSILIAVVFSTFFGVFFGYYPANKAAKMNPIDALRYE